jgi:predicted Rossmann fold flavoprotein
MGATGFGYESPSTVRHWRRRDPAGAGAADLRSVNTLERLAPLSGNAVDAVVSTARRGSAEGMLFTHRGLSGPAILQISSYWREGDEIRIAMLPGVDVADRIRAARRANGRQAVQTVLAAHLPKRLAQWIAERSGMDGKLADLSDEQIKTVAAAVNDWRVKPAGSEGYRTAEVTLGGVDTNALDQKTMQARSVPGLFFIGEVVDVTGWLGGYNFQWAWSSGWVAGQAA